MKVVVVVVHFNTDKYDGDYMTTKKEESPTESITVL